MAQSSGTVVCLLTEKQIKRAAHRSTLELEKAIKQYVEFTNDNPKLFIWTKLLIKSSPASLDFVSEFLRQDTS